MSVGQKQKVLFVLGMDDELERFIQKEFDFEPENMLMLKSFGPVISQPYGDLMRDIITAVYEENADEIFVVGKGNDPKNKEDILNKIYESKELKEKTQSLEYLFQYCNPELPANSLKEWLVGSSTFSEDIEKSVNTIRKHPLIPSHVKVHGLSMNQENGKLLEIENVS